MSVDETSALYAERDGETFFYSERCQQKFLTVPASAKPEEKSRGCCR